MKLSELTDKDAVHVPTKEKWEKLCLLLNKNLYKWCIDTKYEDYNWNTYKELTCLRVIPGDYANLKYFQRNNYTIINVDEFLKRNNLYELWD